MLAKTVDAIHSLCIGVRFYSPVRFGEVRTILDRGIPPAIHQVYPRCFCQIQSNTTSLQTDKEHGHMYIIHYSNELAAMVERMNLPRHLLKYLIVASRACGLMVPSKRQIVKPAFCNLYAIRSKKFTNWLKTMLFVVASCLRRLLSSSMRASILDEERHLTRSRRPRIPCRVFAFSSRSSAVASRSMVSGM